MIDNSKKLKILIAGLEEFAENGFEKASTDSISKKAGVSKGLIFHYFGSKNNLYIEVINKCIDDIMEQFNKLNISDGDFLSIIMKIIEVKCDYFIKNPMNYKLIVNGFYNSPKKLEAELQQRYLELRQMCFNIIMDIVKRFHIKKGISDEDAVAIICSVSSIIEGRYLPLIISGSESFENLYDRAKTDYVKLMNIVLYGIMEEEK